jgi:hypothetical protein
MRKSLRKGLALPFVFTAMLSPAVAFGDAAPPTNKPPTKNPPPVKKLPKADNPDNVFKEPDGTCWQHSGGGHCPPGAHCNPPPPHQVECPPDKK